MWQIFGPTQQAFERQRKAKNKLIAKRGTMYREIKRHKMAMKEITPQMKGMEYFCMSHTLWHGVYTSSLIFEEFKKIQNQRAFDFWVFENKMETKNHWVFRYFKTLINHWVSRKMLKALLTIMDNPQECYTTLPNSLER